MATSLFSGTQSATIGTEHTLCTVSIPGTFLLQVNTKNMVGGDAIELLIKQKVLPGDSSESEFLLATFANVQSDPVKVSIPVVSLYSLVCTLKQTSGTSRSFDWNLVSI